MSGSSRLSLAAIRAGKVVMPPIDYRYQWDLGIQEHRALFKDVYALVEYFSPRCSPWSRANRSRQSVKEKQQEAEIPSLKWLTDRWQFRNQTRPDGPRYATILETPGGSELPVLSPFVVVAGSPPQ